MVFWEVSDIRGNGLLYFFSGRYRGTVPLKIWVFTEGDSSLQCDVQHRLQLIWHATLCSWGSLDREDCLKWEVISGGCFSIKTDNLPLVGGFKPLSSSARWWLFHILRGGSTTIPTSISHTVWWAQQRNSCGEWFLIFQVLNFAKL